ncbi:hypothetical protein Scep_023848 [Stephania cephalantha]|uniref:F-box/LRR-repeat protein 15-like leucin rich repeat domain-containing protein n=1 Tax=Stephania cephalantha TaxID=152367 RepID=A0AAP0F2J5_9MAGN
MAGDRIWDELPEDCWELVLNRLDNHRHFETVSLVCKKLLSISNRIRCRFVVSNPTIMVYGSISRFLGRFHQLKRIDLVGFIGDLDRVVREIGESELAIEVLNISYQRGIPVEGFRELGMKKKGFSLRVLICSRVWVLRDSDLGVIADCFPNLERLDISYPENDLGSPQERRLDSRVSPRIVSDNGVEVLASKLRSLRRINISGNQFISDRSLVNLSKGCEFLAEIAALDCSFLSQSGLFSAIRNCRNLASLSMNASWNTHSASSNPSIAVDSSLFRGRALRDLDLWQMVVSDELLLSIKEANLPLKKLGLRYCQGFTFNGIQSLLIVYQQSLNHLDLEGLAFLSNQSMIALSQYLHELSFISLNFCYNLSSSMFFALMENCPFLKEIQMESTSIGRDGCITNNIKKNTSVEILGLGRNKYLSDTTLVKIGFVCPKLKCLNLSSCSEITKEGIDEIGKCCSEMVELKLNGCYGLSGLGIGFPFRKLKVFDAAWLRISDEGLAVIGGKCIGLLRLNLEGCSGMTEQGVKVVVEKCKSLRELNLNRCCGIKNDILAWLVFARSSLRKIVPPNHSSVSEPQRNLFLRHGCIVS